MLMRKCTGHQIMHDDTWCAIIAFHLHACVRPDGRSRLLRKLDLVQTTRGTQHTLLLQQLSREARPAKPPTAWNTNAALVVASATVIFTCQKSSRTHCAKGLSQTAYVWAKEWWIVKITTRIFLFQLPALPCVVNQFDACDVSLTNGLMLCGYVSSCGNTLSHLHMDCKRTLWHKCISAHTCHIPEGAPASIFQHFATLSSSSVPFTCLTACKFQRNDTRRGSSLIDY